MLRQSAFLPWAIELGPSVLLLVLVAGKLVWFSATMNELLWDWFREPEQRHVLPVTLGTLLLLWAPSISMGRVGRLAVLLGVDALVTTVILADSVYFRAFDDLPTIAELLRLRDVPTIRSSLPHLVSWHDAAQFADVLAGLALLPFYARVCRSIPPVRPGRGRAVALAATLAGLLLAGPHGYAVWRDRDEILAHATLRRDVAATLGVIAYHLYDIADAALSGSSSRPPASVDVDELRKELDTLRRTQRPRGPLFGVARGRNVILVSAESLNAFPIGLVVDGQEITPYLSAFARESLWFVECYDQTYRGTTSDAEFAVLHSLHPLPSSTLPYSHRANRYHALPAILSARGYTTLSAAGAAADFYNMREMHPRLGFERSFFEHHYPTKERIGPWLADHAFFVETAGLLTAQPEPFLAFLLSSTNHHPFELPDGYRSLRLGTLEHSALGRYLHTVHYFDAAFGAFVGALRAAGMLDRSVVVVYGDHQGLRGRAALEAVPGFATAGPLAQWLTQKRVPLLVRLPEAKAAGVRGEAAGHVDVAPTILGLLGIDVSDAVMLGRDLTAPSRPLVVFRDGSFVDGTHAFVNRGVVGRRAACYATATGQAVDCAPLVPRQREARRRLEISDAIIHGDLVERLSGTRLPIRLSHLAPPSPVSDEFGLADVTIEATDVYAHPPSGAAFTLRLDRHGADLVFTPSFVWTVPPDRTDGVTFEVRRGDTSLYRRHVRATERLDPVRIALAQAGEADVVTFALLTSAGPHGNRDHDWALWRDVRIVLHPPRDGTSR
ncbi:MAG TPA: LTA synthase family protein [Candidatus Tectomicrobia bacterium]|nr:LTA synthase family protein [Candidatus Tectomicrobia bacterium]